MKPKHEGGYSPIYAQECERTLVTLLRGLGPWREAVYLIGGLVPRYLVGSGHVGTSDVDLLCDPESFGQVEAYRNFEKNLERCGFQRQRSEEGRRQNFSWTRELDSGHPIILDLLCPATMPYPKLVQPLEGNRQLSALRLEGGHLVLRDFVEVKVEAELLDGSGESSALVRVAGYTSFLTLKALSYEDRREEKDAYDIIYCLTRSTLGPEELGRVYGANLKAWELDASMVKAVSVLRERFKTHRTEGCVSYARFLSQVSDSRANAVRSQEAAAAVAEFLEGVEQSST